MTRVDSSIPEVISMLERNDDGSIQKTISEAIEELSFEGGIRTGIETGQSTESNITEEIAQVFQNLLKISPFRFTYHGLDTQYTHTSLSIPGKMFTMTP